MQCTAVAQFQTAVRDHCAAGHYIAVLIHKTHLEVLNDKDITCYSLDALRHPGFQRNVTSVMYMPAIE